MKKNLLFAAVIATTTLFATSCGNSNNNTSTDTTQAVAGVATSSSISVDELLSTASSLHGQEVQIEGICTHICKHGGRKIFLMGSDDSKTIRIESGEVGKFEQKCVNSIVRVTGSLVEERIDEAYLQRWEAQVKASQAEKHGETEAGCSTEKKARGESGNTVNERIESFRQRIAQQKEKSGKEYLSFYHISATSYEVVE